MYNWLSEFGTENTKWKCSVETGNIQPLRPPPPTVESEQIALGVSVYAVWLGLFLY